MRRSRKAELTAYHEAGHAVLEYVQGRAKIAYVTIEPDGEYLGMVRREVSVVLPYYDDNEVRVFLAGPLAERTYSGRWDWNGGAEDLHVVIQQLIADRGRFSIPPTEYSQILTRSVEMTASLVAEYWPSIQRVAAEADPSARFGTTRSCRRDN